MSTAILPNNTTERNAGQLMDPDRLHASVRLSIALELLRMLARNAGLPDSTGWLDVPQDTRFRLLELGDRAIRSLDLDVKVRHAAEAVAETEDWMAGAYLGAGTEPTTGDIAREAIARFCARESRS